MRDRRYLNGGEAARPFSEIRAERQAGDVDELLRRRRLEEIARLESEAAELTDPAARVRKQCEAEALRIALDEEQPRRRGR